ncbi:MAG TPA: transporter substrate-binding domain-containing protein [Kaistia sp.]|nr:transporter substrate-binding domain-containing protein [Kaistia sp.]
MNFVRRLASAAAILALVLASAAAVGSSEAQEPAPATPPAAGANPPAVEAEPVTPAVVAPPPSEPVLEGIPEPAVPPDEAPVNQGEEVVLGPQRPIRVGVHLSAPFVMKRGNKYTGMAIDLWESLAGQLQRTYAYQEFPTVGALIKAAHDDQIDIAVSNITVNESRARRIDFTQPWFDAGLRIMINERSHASVVDVIGELRDAGFLTAYARIGLVLLIATVLMTFFDRHFDAAFPKRWRDGFGESFYTVMQIATTGKPAARKNLFGWIGRVWQGIWLMAGVAVIAYVTSSVTTVMATLSAANQIRNIGDLEGHTIGVIKDTVSDDFVREQGLRNIAFLTFDEAIAALQSGDVDAIIEDGPVLQYYMYTHPRADVRLVGPRFEPSKYAFGTPQNSVLRRPVTIELLSSEEHDEIDKLRVKYFGQEQ